MHWCQPQWLFSFYSLLHPNTSYTYIIRPIRTHVRRLESNSRVSWSSPLEQPSLVNGPTFLLSKPFSMFTFCSFCPYLSRVQITSVLFISLLSQRSVALDELPNAFKSFDRGLIRSVTRWPIDVGNRPPFMCEDTRVDAIPDDIEAFVVSSHLHRLSAHDSNKL
jgi:hypothetical protein